MKVEAYWQGRFGAYTGAIYFIFHTRYMLILTYDALALVN
jgi:hypothetical protein